MNRALAIFVHIQTNLGQENLPRMVRCHCPPDTGFEIQTLEVWGRARYLSFSTARLLLYILSLSKSPNYCYFCMSLYTFFFCSRTFEMSAIYCCFFRGKLCIMYISCSKNNSESQSQRLPAILRFTCGWRRNIFVFFQTTETGKRTRSSSVRGSGANHHPRAPAHNRFYAVLEMTRCVRNNPSWQK